MTLTDFRISGLVVPELEWEWKAELAQVVTKAIAAAVVVAEDPPVEDVKPIVAPSSPIAPEPVDLPPPSSSPSKVDMSIDSINVSELLDADEPVLEVEDTKPTTTEDTVDAEEVDAPDADAEPAAPSPKKKPTKKQKKAEAAAMRAAKKLADVEESGSKKDGNKHGRDEDEGDDSVVVADVLTKKVKPDKGEVVTLESVDVGMDPEPVKPVPSTPGPPTIHPLPTKPLPTGPAADSPRAPTNRENSRLRIYFSSPVASPSTHPAVSSAEKKLDALATVASTSAPVPAALPVVQESPIEEPAIVDAATDAAPEVVALGEEDIDGEDLDGEDIEEEVVQLSATDAREVVAAQDSDDSDSDDVESSLIIKPAAIEAAAAADTVDTSAAPELVVVMDNSSYPPDPYSQSVAPSPTDSSALHVSAPPAVLAPEPSADRISISYARNTRRIVLDASVVDSVKIHRADGKIELVLSCQPATQGEGEETSVDEFRVCRGILVRPHLHFPVATTLTNDV